MIYLDENALIPQAKLTQYLLVKLTKNDKSGYLAQAGYTIDNWKQLEEKLIIDRETKETKFVTLLPN